MKVLLAPDIVSTMRACAKGFLAAIFFSSFVNLLNLAPTLYMTQVYDRVLNSGNGYTLVSLTLVTLAALVALSLLDEVRSRILIRISIRIDRLLAERVVAAQVERLQRLPGFERTQVVRDLDNIRQFMTGGGIQSFLDVPWTPIFLIFLYTLSPTVCLVALFGVVGVLTLAMATEWATGKKLNSANAKASRNYAMTESILRNTEIIQAMGMLPAILVRWSGARRSMMRDQVEASDWAGILNSAIRWYRLAIQTVLLAVGAWEVIQHRLTGGEMFAAMVLMGRAITPIEMAVGGWRHFVSARAAFSSLNNLLGQHPPPPPAMMLPKPQGTLEVRELFFTVPTAGGMAAKPLFRGLEFTIQAGECICVIGPSGAGKSSLARLLTGVWIPQYGTIRLDGAETKAWDREQFGRAVGYLPQDIELFPGTVRENIARFTDASDEEVVRVAKMADVHDLILQLPDGYNTNIGEGGGNLSGGQRQRLGLARALFGDPVLLILDEPNSNLDATGEQALHQMIAAAKKRRVTVIIISHRMGVLSLSDKIMMLSEGQIKMFCSREEALERLNGKPAQPVPTLTAAAIQPALAAPAPPQAAAPRPATPR
ncbi:MAG: type I secretion system permease/ATPase, partial [Magnetococcales bacterium]|nr:type I secretion system permease/ATPase [Magnetococcales bacterium]